MEWNGSNLIPFPPFSFIPTKHNIRVLTLIKGDKNGMIEGMKIETLQFFFFLSKLA